MEFTGYEVRLELKYCEQCGGLLLRRAGHDVVFCDPCARRVEDMPAPRARRGASVEARA